MSAPELYPYQRDVIAEFDRTREHKRRIILVAPTGAGKTVIGADIIRSFVRTAKSVLVLAIGARSSPRPARNYALRESVTESSRPAFRRARSNWCKSPALQTLHARAVRSDRMDLPPADLLWIDEAHHVPAESYRAIIEAYPDAILLGATATPCRGDGRGLGGIFETIIECPQVAELIEQGYLVKTRVYAPVDPDLQGVRTVAGDYVEKQLAERMDQPQLVGDIVTHWHKFGERRKTVCLRRQRRALHPHPRRIREVRRARRAHRRLDTQSTNAMQRSRGWHPAKSNSSPIAWC